jgi:hypothetical protein
MHCSLCYRTLSAAEPVYRGRVSDGRGAYNIRSWGCEPCQMRLWRSGPDPEGTWRRFQAQWRSRPCKCCDRPVYIRTKQKTPRHVVCSATCGQAAKLAQARNRRAQLRPKATCETCGKLFPPLRIGARFCSSPCRQRAYRQRQHAEAAA